MRRGVLVAVGLCFALLTWTSGTVVAEGSPPNLAGAGSATYACGGKVPVGYARCHSLVHPRTDAVASGLNPSAIKSVYQFPTSLTAGAGQTVAIVDAYNDPNIENDLAVFSQQFGLPTCTTTNGCFTKVNQRGSSNSKQLPRNDAGWSLEIALDVEWAHAIAPGAKILLVEASSNSFLDLLTAESYASAHAHSVSNSWGGTELAGEQAYDPYFSRAGVSFFVSAGDSGTGAEYPSASPNVISVGGTRLNFSGSAFTSETGWSGSGGGCSKYETANAVQSAFGQYAQVSCGGKRATPDVSLDADPASGVSVYDSFKYQGRAGWFVVGGTSASSPMWAARSVTVGQTVNSAYIYGKTITFRDITSGNDGKPCLPGYDLVTGRGSWD